ncbi:unnamed protein product [Mesocestoides corti]|uniref:Uncharacterized protein n=1 Tax=Mesocestoides corti TaxID=53468 RepID=A0A0R3UMQ4_MESCO|nr:unnamed protein product [Mesocestoides corti]
MIQCRTASPTLQFKYACLCRDEPDMRWMEPQILLRGFDVPKASGCEHLRSMLRHRLPASPYPCGNHHHRADKMRPSFHVTLPFVRMRQLGIVELVKLPSVETFWGLGIVLPQNRVS